MNIKDIDIHNMPDWMGLFVDEINNRCEALLKESQQYNGIVDEIHELLEKYLFLSTLLDGDEIKEPLDLSLTESKVLSRFFCLDDDKRFMELFQTYLLGCRHMFEMLQLLRLV